MPYVETRERARGVSHIVHFKVDGERHSKSFTDAVVAAAFAQEIRDQHAQRGPRNEPLLDRLQRQVVVEPWGCWTWTGRTTRDGYGSVSWTDEDGRARAGGAHRVAYQLLVGPIPDDLHLDHLCHTRDKTCAGGPQCPHRRCWNPEHLEPVTPLENTLRARPATSTACARGHEWTEATTKYRKGTHRRYCSLCRREDNHRRRCSGETHHPSISCAEFLATANREASDWSEDR